MELNRIHLSRKLINLLPLNFLKWVNVSWNSNFASFPIFAVIGQNVCRKKSHPLFHRKENTDRVVLPVGQIVAINSSRIFEARTATGSGLRVIGTEDVAGSELKSLVAFSASELSASTRTD